MPHSATPNNKSRDAINLQYCTPNNITKIPANYAYPNTMWKKTKPPCILLFGNDSFNYNKIISKDHAKYLSNTLNRIRIKFIYKPLYEFLVFSRKIYFEVKKLF
jgi:hypothetical protein